MSIKETNDGTFLTIFVKPNAPKFKIELDRNEIVVHSTEEPVKGKVNKQILKEIAKLFNLRVEIVSGLTSRQKVLFLRDISRAKVEATLKSKIVSKAIN